MEEEEIVADVLNAISQSNLDRVAGQDVWSELVHEYFTMETEREPDSEVEDSDDDGEDEDTNTPSVVTDPLDEVERLPEVVITDDLEAEMEKVRNYR